MGNSFPDKDNYIVHQLDPPDNYYKNVPQRCNFCICIPTFAIETPDDIPVLCDSHFDRYKKKYHTINYLDCTAHILDCYYCTMGKKEASFKRDRARLYTDYVNSISLLRKT